MDPGTGAQVQQTIKYLKELGEMGAESARTKNGAARLGRRASPH